jgi:hypothetical protein
MPEPSAADLQALALRLARTAEAQGAGFAGELADILARIERRLPVLLERALAGRVAAASTAAQLGLLRRQLRQLLTEAGYDDLIDISLSAGLDATLATVAATSPAYRRMVAFSSRGRPGAFHATLRALIEVGRQDLLQQGAVLSQQLWRASARGYLGAQPASAILAELATILQRSQAHTATLYDTAVSTFQRVAVQTIVPVTSTVVGDNIPADAPLATGGDILPRPADQLYWYAGPADGLVRPFCREHLGKVYTRPEIDAMENNQLPNVFLTGGGYNCRHLWMPISRVSSLADLQGTDRRAPEVEAQLRATPPMRPRRRRRAPRRLSS